MKHNLVEEFPLPLKAILSQICENCGYEMIIFERMGDETKWSVLGEVKACPRCGAARGRNSVKDKRKSEQEQKVLYYCREWYRTGGEVIKQTLWYEIGVMLENEPDTQVARVCEHGHKIACPHGCL